MIGALTTAALAFSGIVGLGVIVVLGLFFYFASMKRWD